jgi:hypothetical protein
VGGVEDEQRFTDLVERHAEARGRRRAIGQLPGDRAGGGRRRNERAFARENPLADLELTGPAFNVTIDRRLRHAPPEGNRTGDAQECESAADQLVGPSFPRHLRFQEAESLKAAAQHGRRRQWAPLRGCALHVPAHHLAGRQPEQHNGKCEKHPGGSERTSRL